MWKWKWKFKLIKRFISSAPDITAVGIGSVEVKLPKRQPPRHLVPAIECTHSDPIYLRAINDSQECLAHLRWMMQKEVLQQDMMLIGPPSSLKRLLALKFCETIQRPYEYVSLSRDTSATDLKQRREIINGEAVFIDQAAVTAAKQGRILILDGLERVERNILPILNNLLENREMPLDDGTMLVSADRYEYLKNSHTEEEISKMGLIPVHADFRIIGITSPVPPFPGSPLDPPLRSRFQGRYVNFLDPLDTTLHTLNKLYNTNDIEALKNACMFTAALQTEPQVSGKEMRPKHLLVSPLFPSVYTRACLKFPYWNPVEHYNFVNRIYPYKLVQQNQDPNTSGTVFGTSSSEAAKNVIDETVNSFVKLNKEKQQHAAKLTLQTIVKDNSESQRTGKLTFADEKGNSYDLEVAVGGGSPNIATYHSLIPSFQTILNNMLFDHSLGKDICLIGEKGIGKTELIRKFAATLGYSPHTLLLFADISQRELTLQRASSLQEKEDIDTQPKITVYSQTQNAALEAGHPISDTSWKLSSLIEGAQRGDLVVLEHVDRLPSTLLESLSPLLLERETALFDGRKVISDVRFNQISEFANGLDRTSLSSKYGLVPVHPAFRVIATAHSTAFINSETAEFFSYHTVNRPPVDEMQKLILGGSESAQKKRSKTEQQLARDLAIFSNSLPELSLNLSATQLNRIFSRIVSKRYSVYDAIAQVQAVHSIPSNDVSTQAQLQHLVNRDLSKYDKFFTNADQEEIVSENLDASLKADASRSVHAHLVPRVSFYGNPDQADVVEELKQDLNDQNTPLLLVGSQGVGKNRVIDHLLEKNNLPRQYMQLHRDITVSSLTTSAAIRDGKLYYEESPLVIAVKHGHVLVIDEADKAQAQVISVLRALIKGDMALPGGKRCVSKETASLLPPDMQKDLIQIHPNFRLVVLANKPQWPFQGNDFFQELGDMFVCHAVINPNINSQVEILKKYAPDVPPSKIKAICAAFDLLRQKADQGDTVNQPLSLRESLHVVKHLQRFPTDSLEQALANVLSFDMNSPAILHEVRKAFSQFGIDIHAIAEKSGIPKQTLEVYYRMSSPHSTPKFEATDPKHGKVDPKNCPHVGGNTWAGGTGGSNTAGLGGRGGPYRLDAGHTIHQISEEEKRNVSAEVLSKARKIAEEALKKRLQEIDMSVQEAIQYENILSAVEPEIEQLRNLFATFRGKREERKWLKNRSTGDLDEDRLVEALSGDKHVYKERGGLQKGKGDGTKHLCFVLDISGSMYRFNSYDMRLNRMLEISCIIMESFKGVDSKKITYSIRGHSGDSCNISLVNSANPPKDEKERLKVLKRMIAHAQFCQAGDNTIEACQQAIKDLEKEKVENKIVFLFSDANLDRYGIQPHHLSKAMKSDKVECFAFFIAGLGDQADRCRAGVPVGRGYVCTDTHELPSLFKKVLLTEVLHKTT